LSSSSPFRVPLFFFSILISCNLSYLKPVSLVSSRIFFINSHHILSFSHFSFHLKSFPKPFPCHIQFTLFVSSTFPSSQGLNTLFTSFSEQFVLPLIYSNIPCFSLAFPSIS
jgi:hypothetical protein